MRGLDCLESEHGRTFEFPDVYMVLDGFSARVIREFYTHIGGAPTRLQASTRYIDYAKGFAYFTPPSIERNLDAKLIWQQLMSHISLSLQELEELGIPREDSANGLPLGMETRVACKYNLRTLLDMSRQRMCQRAYHEYRNGIMGELLNELHAYSDEWAYLVDCYFKPKCEHLGWCPEKKSCGLMPKREEVLG